MNQCERHFISKDHRMYNIIDDLCFKSKNLYNFSNYIIRQEFIKKNKVITYNELYHIVKNSNEYRTLGSNIGQGILRVLCKNWKSFLVSRKDYFKNPNKYFGKPNLVGYLDKNGRFPLYLDSNKIRLLDSKIYFSWQPLKIFNNSFNTKINARIIQIRFIPKFNEYIMEVVYNKEDEVKKEYNNRVLGIDLGVNNFVTLSNNIGDKSIIINGKPLKSINQYYNKKKSKLLSELKIKNNKHKSKRLSKLERKRYFKIDYFLHKTSKFIVDYCINNNINSIVIGLNKTWKQECNMSKNNNQKFVSIPYSLFINKLKYKSENKGINFIITEESYTSKCSFLDNETLCKKEKYKGKRIERGLYKSKNKTLINADLNASYNIIKKVFPECFDGIEGVDLHPYKLNVYKTGFNSR